MPLIGTPDDREATTTATPPPPAAPRVWTAGTLTYTATGLAVLFAWLLWGDFAWQFKERAVNPVAQLVLKEFKSSDFYVGLLVYSTPAALAIVLGPVVCTWSDRHRGRRGRRIPYLLLPAPLVGVTLAGMAFTPELGRALHAWLGAHSPGADVSTVIVFSFFWILSEVAGLTALYLFYALINDVVPRDFIGRFFGLFRAVSLLAGIVFNLWVIGYAETHYRTIFLGLALLYGVGFTLMCLRVREGAYPPPEPPPASRGGDGGGGRGRLAPVVAYFRDSFSDPYYLWIYAATTLGAVAFGPVNSFSVLYAKSVGVAMGTYGKYLVVTYVISFALSYALGWLADRFHPLRVGIGSMAAYAAVTLWAGFFATTPFTFALAFVAHGVVSGCFFTVQVPIFQRLLPAAKFGQLYSAANLVAGIGLVVLPAAVGLMLDKTGYVYRYTFLAGGWIGLLAFAAMLVVDRRFKRLGEAANDTTSR